jgi:hypothetical protein
MAGDKNFWIKFLIVVFSVPLAVFLVASIFAAKTAMGVILPGAVFLLLTIPIWGYALRELVLFVLYMLAHVIVLVQQLSTPYRAATAKSLAQSVCGRKWYLKKSLVFDGRTRVLDPGGWREVGGFAPGVMKAAVLEFVSADSRRDEMCLYISSAHPIWKKVGELGYLEVVEFESATIPHPGTFGCNFSDYLALKQG